ncbi:LacI family transcriptional regulator [Stackebrandtia endophytica]|uniref:LacI family transcriptional regulator n=1 Tax=Stackebrandtia endophytica TaxID=1496996 RepID=A0A543B1Y2_9ACTN|nr:LacI family DNA-binding transcriptional regulator [Stackebrandtia endophytica]TQL78843.1 LacI family transcriptional regulator [Stackebrandtia endophytica]
MNRQPGLRDVAKAAEVSVALASLALNDKPGVSAATRQRILAVADSLGYQANPAARALRLGRTDSYGLILRNLQNPFFLDVITGVQEAAAAQGATVLISDADYSHTRELEAVDHLAAQRVAGLAIAPVGPGDAVARWRQLCPGKPVVVLNAVSPQLPGVQRVAPDNQAAVSLAVRHLVELGHRRIAFLTAPAEVMADHDRLETYQAECDRLGIDCTPVATALAFDAVLAVTSRLLRSDEPPTAVITNSDFTAHAVYSAARREGVEVGAGLSVIGHDDLPTSALLDPPLTTLSLDRRALGRAVFERMTSASTFDDHVEPVDLVVRASTAAPTV